MAACGSKQAAPNSNTPVKTGVLWVLYIWSGSECGEQPIDFGVERPVLLLLEFTSLHASESQQQRRQSDC